VYFSAFGEGLEALFWARAGPGERWEALVASLRPRMDGSASGLNGAGRHQESEYP
jgi:hypothetical protein